jgi:hypothetical protein
MMSKEEYINQLERQVERLKDERDFKKKAAIFLLRKNNKI